MSSKSVKNRENPEISSSDSHYKLSKEPAAKLENLTLLQFLTIWEIDISDSPEWSGPKKLDYRYRSAIASDRI